MIRPALFLGGRYKETVLTSRRTFSTNTVRGNMTPYAKWLDKPIGLNQAGKTKN
jgi:hypothetical protein